MQYEQMIGAGKGTQAVLVFDDGHSKVRVMAMKTGMEYSIKRSDLNRCYKVIQRDPVLKKEDIPDELR